MVNMKTILFLIFPFILLGQTYLTETFSNYVKTDTTNVVVNYVFSPEWHTALGGDNDSLIEDISGKGRDLRIQGWASYAALLDSTTGTNILYSGGEGLKFNNNNHYLDRADGTSFPSGSGADWSIVVFGRVNAATAANQVFTFWGGGGATNTPTAYFETTPKWVISTIGAANDLTSTDAFSIPTNVYFAGTVDNTTESLYIDGVSAATPKSITNAPNTVNYRIGRFTVASFPLKATLFQVIVYNKALSEKEITELAFMPTGWAAVGADAPGVSRVSWGFYLGLTGADSVYYNTALTAGNWTISIKDSAASGVTYKILTSADASTWTTLTSGTTGTSWDTKSYNGTGSGYIGISVASGAAYFDDLVVTLLPETAETANKKPEFSKYPEFIKF